MSLFHTQLLKEGTLSKPAKQVITGIHLLNVTGLVISPSGMLYSTSAEGSVQQFKVGKKGIYQMMCFSVHLYKICRGRFPSFWKVWFTF